jgi:hypothetical protein
MPTITVRVLAGMSEALAEEVEHIFTKVLSTRPEDPPPLVFPKLCEVEFMDEFGEVE